MSPTAEAGQMSLEAERRRVCSLADEAEAHLNRGRHPQAESLLRGAMAIAVKAFGREDLAVARLLNNLAVVHKYQGRFAEAGRLYRRALRIAVRVLGPGHPQVAAISHNLGGLEHARRLRAVGRPRGR